MALAAPQAAIIARVTRSALIDTLAEDWMRTARAKGLTASQALWRHGLPNALIPIPTILGLQFPFLLAGGVIIENVFFLPGLGRLVLQAITQRDLIVVQGVIMLLVFAVVATNFLVDVAYVLVDPRLRRRGPRTARASLPTLIVSCRDQAPPSWPPPWSRWFGRPTTSPPSTSIIVCRGPSPAHLAGPGPLGRDVASMILLGARNALSVSLVAVLTGAGHRRAAGLLARRWRGLVDELVMRASDGGLRLSGPDPGHTDHRRATRAGRDQRGDRDRRLQHPCFARLTRGSSPVLVDPATTSWPPARPARVRRGSRWSTSPRASPAC
ncbi:ABC transporter permease subunit [Caulobacter segnis]